MNVRQLYEKIIFLTCFRVQIPHPGPLDDWEKITPGIRITAVIPV